MDIQIGWHVYGSAGRHVHTVTCLLCLQCADLLTSSLLNLHSGLFIYKHVIGNAGLLSSSASVKAIYGVCILLWGYGCLSPRHSIMTRLFLRCNLRIVSHIVIGTRFCT